MSKVLHLLRSEPDETVNQFISSMGDDAKILNLYDGEQPHKPIDWGGIVDDIMSHDKVISWW